MDKVAYEEILENIYEKFGRVAMIPLIGAAECVGIDKRYLQSDKGFPLKKVSGRYYVGTVALARWLS